MSSEEVSVNLKRQRVIAYVDGFNLYYGLRHASYQSDIQHIKHGGNAADCLGRSLYWLDLRRVIPERLRKDEELIAIKYFTAPRRVPRNVQVSEAGRKRYIESNERQRVYLEALRTLEGVEVIEGWYSENNPYKCIKCGFEWPAFEEKMTDVNIATHILCDAFHDRFDRALLMTADADLVPAVRATKDLGKEVLLILPPGRKRAQELRKVATVTQNIKIKALRGRRLPDVIQRPVGQPVRCPERWREGLGWIWGESPPVSES